jgi:hypothetical protein
MKQVDKEYILDRVGKALDGQFEMYSWEDMLEDCDLTPEELAWAKEHIGYMAYIF